MATITIDGKEYEVQDGQNLLQASLALGLNLPYFCWHPALGSVGACRQCAVKQFRGEDDEQGKLVMACMTPADDGTRISIKDEEASEFRRTVIEWLMVNHPHDCPVCDEGGECHLQDMTVMTGHNYREFRFDKRTHRNQDLGPFVNHEMNRCIACYRCVRFYRDYAGGRDFNVFGAHDDVYFGRYQDGPLESEFSGNLVEICPTGVFTDKTLYRHYTRKWDLQTAPSICQGCSLGCNTIPGERYGQLRRIRNRYNHEINGYFLCDRGRYGYEFVNDDSRIRQARVDGRPVDRQAAIDHVASLLKEGLPQGQVIGIGSPRASLEANYALRELVGKEHFYLGLSRQERQLTQAAVDILRRSPVPSATLRQVAESDAVFVLGEDVTNTAPMMALALRQAVRQEPMRLIEPMHIPAWQDSAVREALENEPTGPLYIGSMHQTKLDSLAKYTYHGAPEDLARLAFAVAHILDEKAPPVPDFEPELQPLAEEIAQALRQAQHPLVISGVSSGSGAVLQAAANVAWALHGADLSAHLALIFPEVNSLGLALLGNGDLEEALKQIQDGAAETVVVLENDLYRRAPAEEVSAMLAKANVVVLDHLETGITAEAGTVLPAATFAESDGTYVNNESRAQPAYQVFVPDGDVQASWRWLADLLAAQGQAAWTSWDDLVAAMAQSEALFAPLARIAPPAGFRIHGQRIPRQPQRYSGRGAIHAGENVSEPQPPQDPETPLAFSMEGSEQQPPPALIARYWSPGWNSVQALNRFQEEIAGPLRGGELGQRLIEPAPDSPPGDESPGYFFAGVPAAFEPGAEEWCLLPLYHIFGSDELSLKTPGISERAPEPYLALNPDDAERAGLAEGDLAALDAGLVLPVRFVPSLPAGTAGLPVGLTAYWEVNRSVGIRRYQAQDGGNQP